VHHVRIALLLALSALVALATAGCAAPDSPSSAAANVRAPAQPPEPEPFVTIDAPGAKAVHATQDRLGIRAMAEVAGRANAGDLVQVSSGCADARCAAGVQVGADGRWSTRLLLKATRSSPRVRVVAQTGAQVAISLARLAPPKERTPKHKAAPARRRATTATAATAAPTTTTSTAPAPDPLQTTPAPASTSSPSRMVLIGDSLAVGIQASLTKQLSGWSLSTNARVGRPLAEGMSIVRAMPDRPPVLGISLFTNDAPGATSTLRAAVQETIDRQSGHGCVIWATIVRPAVGGVTYARANAVLAGLAAANPSVMKLVPWAQVVADHPEWMAADGVHATPTGYAARAQMYADAARSCASAVTG
jgi:hypothetical protein